MESAAKESDVKLYVKLAVILFLIFGFQFLPPVSSLTPTGMHVLGIFLGCVYGWSTVGLLWPSIFALVSMSFVQGHSMASIMANGLGSTVTWTLVFVLMFIEVFNRVGGIDFVSAWFLTRKVLNGRPLLFTFVFLFVTIIVGMLTGVGATLLSIAFLYGVCNVAGYDKHDRYPKVMLMGISVMALFGNLSLALLGTPLILAGAFESATGIVLTLFDFFKITLVFTIFSDLIFTLSVKYVFRCDLEPLKRVDVTSITKSDNLKASKELKTVAVFLAIMLVGVVGASLIPKTVAIGSVLNKLGLLGITMLLIGIMTYTKVDGKFFFDFNKYAYSVKWDIVFIAAVIMPLSGMITMEGTGIEEFISTTVGVVMAPLPAPALVAALLFACMILTNFGNNVSICLLLMPVVLTVGTAAGIDSRALYMCLIFASHLAILTPGACPVAAIVWGQTEWLVPKDIYKYGAGVMTLIYLCVVLVCYPWSCLMFGVSLW